MPNQAMHAVRSMLPCKHLLKLCGGHTNILRNPEERLLKICIICLMILTLTYMYMSTCVI